MTVNLAQVRSTSQLLEFIGGGGQPKYLFFWGHQPQPDGGVGKGCFSQWWPAKFGQHPDLRDYLLTTGDRVLVEASPRDRVWGIGMAASNDLAASPEHWRGLNLLGFALMEARHQLRGGN